MRRAGSRRQAALRNDRRERRIGAEEAGSLAVGHARFRASELEALGCGGSGRVDRGQPDGRRPRLRRPRRPRPRAGVSGPQGTGAASSAPRRSATRGWQGYGRWPRIATICPSGSGEQPLVPGEDDHRPVPQVERIGDQADEDDRSGGEQPVGRAVLSVDDQRGAKAGPNGVEPGEDGLARRIATTLATMSASPAPPASSRASRPCTRTHQPERQQRAHEQLPDPRWREEEGHLRMAGDHSTWLSASDSAKMGRGSARFAAGPHPEHHEEREDQIVLFLDREGPGVQQWLQGRIRWQSRTRSPRSGRWRRTARRRPRFEQLGEVGRTGAPSIRSPAVAKIITNSAGRIRRARRS